MALTKYATSVTIVHQFGHFQAFEHAIEEARSNPKISFVMESVITRFFGNEKLTRTLLLCFSSLRNTSYTKNCKKIKITSENIYIIFYNLEMNI